MPGVEVRITTTQAELDPSDRDFDLGIIFGNGDWARCRTTKLFDEEVYPICSPAYLAGRTLPQSAAAIADMRLLHLHADKRQRWFDWADWMTERGVSATGENQSATFSNFQLVMQAVLMGQGAAIGFLPLIDDMVAASQVVCLTDRPLSSERGYFLVEPEESVGNPLIQIVRDWVFSTRNPQ